MQTPVSRYHDHNTRRFLRLAAVGSDATILRAVWSAGVTSRTEAVGRSGLSVSGLHPRL